MKKIIALCSLVFAFTACSGLIKPENGSQYITQLDAEPIRLNQKFRYMMPMMHGCIWKTESRTRRVLGTRTGLPASVHAQMNG